MSQKGSSVLGEAIADEIGDAAGRRWVQVRQDGDHVAALGINLQIAIHPWGTATVTEVPSAGLSSLIGKSEGVFAAAGRFDFSGGQEIGIFRVQQLVIQKRSGKAL